MKKANKITRIIQKFKTLEKVDLLWCDSLEIEDEKFNNLSISVDVNEFNYLTYIKIHFFAENPPGYEYIGKISVSDFNNKQELYKLIQKQTKLANNNITDAILRAAQIDMFE